MAPIQDVDQNGLTMHKLYISKEIDRVETLKMSPKTTTKLIRTVCE